MEQFGKSSEIILINPRLLGSYARVSIFSYVLEIKVVLGAVPPLVGSVTHYFKVSIRLRSVCEVPYRI